jgi:hypothetical protein
MGPIMRYLRLTLECQLGQGYLLPKKQQCGSIRSVQMLGIRDTDVRPRKNGIKEAGALVNTEEKSCSVRNRSLT